MSFWRKYQQLAHDFTHTESARLGLWSPVFVGIGVALYFSLSAMPTAFAVGAAGAAALAGLLINRVLPLRLGFMVFLLFVGFIAAHLQTTARGTAMLTGEMGARMVSGRVADIEPHDKGHRVVLDDVSIDGVAANATPHSVRFTYTFDALPRIGAQVACNVEVLGIAGPVLPGGYDFRQHYYFERLGATGFALAPCTVTGAAQADWMTGLYDATADARNSLRATIRQHLTGDRAAIAEALMTGVQQGISEPTMEAMRVSGLVHILSVSGLHIGLAAGIVFFVLRALLALVPYIALRFNIKKWAAVAALLSAVAYTFFVGAPIPAIRACLMTALMLTAVLLDRQALSLRVVALAATFILLVWPANVLNPSFQLSFAAITAIVAMIEGTEDWRTKLLEDRPWILRVLFYIGGIAVTSLVASIATLPFTYYHFQQVNLYGLIANMLAGPLTSFWLMPMAILGFILAPLGWAGVVLAWLGEGIEWLIAIARGVAALPGADWPVAAMPYAALVCLVAGALWVCLWRHNWRWLGVLPIAAGFAITWLAPLPVALVDRKGSYAVVQDGERYVLIAGKRVNPDNFVLTQWKRYLGVENFVSYRDHTGCISAGCDLGVSVYWDNKKLESCPARLVLLKAPAAQCAALIDRNALQTGGAHRINADYTAESAAAYIGDWPWRSAASVAP